MSLNSKTLFISGCDTDVGKTVVTSALAAHWQAQYPARSLGLMKVMQTGVGDDEQYQALFAPQKHWDIVTPLKLPLPLAPPIAADQVGVTIDLLPIRQRLEQLQHQHTFVLVEALGGLGSPVTHDLTVADIAGQWRLNTVLVIPVKLGALGQAIAQVALAKEKQVKLKGFVLNCVNPVSREQVDNWANVALLEAFTGLPLLGITPFLSPEQRQSTHYLAQVAADYDLDRLGL